MSSKIEVEENNKLKDAKKHTIELSRTAELVIILCGFNSFHILSRHLIHC